MCNQIKCTAEKEYKLILINLKSQDLDSEHPSAKAVDSFNSTSYI